MTQVTEQTGTAIKVKALVGSGFLGSSIEMDSNDPTIEKHYQRLNRFGNFILKFSFREDVFATESNIEDIYRYFTGYEVKEFLMGGALKASKVLRDIKSLRLGEGLCNNAECVYRHLGLIED